MMAAVILSPRYDKPLPLLPLHLLEPHARSDLIPAPLSPTKTGNNHGPSTHIVRQFEVTPHHRRLRSDSPPSAFQQTKISRLASPPDYDFSRIPPFRTPLQKPSIERMQANRVYERTIAPIASGDASVDYAELPGSEVPTAFQGDNMLQSTEPPTLVERPPMHPNPDMSPTNGSDEWSARSSVASLRQQGSQAALRGSSPSELSTHSLRSAKSIPDKLSNRFEHRNFSAPTYTRPSRGYTSRELRHTSPPRKHPLHSEQYAAEVRPSFYSNLTNGSSVNDTTTTDRSSVMTGQSSQSDWPKVVGSRPQTAYGEELSVEDAIAMYIEGFETDKEVEPQLEEELQDVIEPVKLEVPSALHVQKRPATSSHAHRRSQSASILERSPQIPQRPSTANNLSIPPPPGPILRSSTQIVSNQVSSTFEVPRLATFHPAPTSSRDRYGFKKSSQHVTESTYDAWNNTYTSYLDRRKKKWIEFMGREGLLVNRRIDKEIPVRFPAKSDKTKRYIRKGIPPEWRGAAWFWYAGGPERLQRHPGLYPDLLRRAEAGKLNESDREHIERDLFRTFPDNVHFKPDGSCQPSGIPDSSSQPVPTAKTNADSSAHDSVLSSLTAQADIETPLIRSLRRVLQAFAIHNPLIGYCQSLNFLTALLLLLLSGDEEKAFHMLCILTAVHLPGTHGTALEGANVDIAVLMGLLKERLPNVWARVNDTDTADPHAATRLPTVSLATTSWFMSVFVGTLPIEAVLRVWDVLFYEGSKTLFRIALALFQLAGPRIAAASTADPMDVFQLVQSFPRTLVDANLVMDTAFGLKSSGAPGRGKKGFSAVSQATVEERRAQRRDAIKRQVSTRLGEAERGRDVREKGRTGSGLRRAVSKARLRRGKREKEERN